jgi:hypothetical protein
MAINKALSDIVGSPLRTDLLTWFNEIMKDIFAQPREWAFLEEPLTINIVNNQIQLPLSSISQIQSIQLGDVLYTIANQLSTTEAVNIDNAEATIYDNSSCIIPPNEQGYTVDWNTGLVTFHPDVSDTDTYNPTPTTAQVIADVGLFADYADNTATIFPYIPFEALFMSGVRWKYYKTQKDGRFTAERMQYDIEMKNCKMWDNRLKPDMHYSPRGYTRG